MVSTFHTPRFVMRAPQFVAFTRNASAPRVDRLQPGQGSIPITVWEDSQHVYVEADLPGLQPQQVDVRIEDDSLKIAAERLAPERAGPTRHDERVIGPVQRTLGLGKQIDRTRVDALLRDGVLRITLHKRPEAQAQKVNVQYAAIQPESATPPAAGENQS